MILTISPNNAYATNRLEAEAKKAGLGMELIDVNELAKKNFSISFNKYNLLYIRQAHPFIPQVINLAKKFRKLGKIVINRNIIKGDLGLGKLDMYEKLRNVKIPTPKTYFLTEVKNIFQISDAGARFSRPNSERAATISTSLEVAVSHFEWLKASPYKTVPFALYPKPYILKWNYGFGGKGIFLIRSQQNIQRALKNYPEKELLVQELIKADFEYKIITIGFKALPVIIKVKFDQKTFKPILNKPEIIDIEKLPTGSFLNKHASKAIKLAEKSSRILGRELAKTDILQKGNNFYVLEVNSNPGLSYFENTAKYNVALEFAKYLKKCEA